MPDKGKALGKVDKDGYEEISVDFYRFTQEGEYLEGVLAAKDTQTIGDVEVGRYEMDLADTHKRTAFLGGVQLDRLMDSVEVGDNIRLVFQGLVATSGGKKVKTFKLYRKAAQAKTG